MKCFDQKLSPPNPNPNDQLAALEIPLTIFDKIAIPQHHKESAIEAFCDVTAVQYLRDNFHATWATTATHIANYRKIQFDIKNSSTAADYFTHLAIFHFIEAPKSVTPLSAAKQTYTESKSRAKIMENAKMVMSEHIDDAIASINATRKSLATKLKNTRLAKLFHHGKPPTAKP